VRPNALCTRASPARQRHTRSSTTFAWSSAYRHARRSLREGWVGAGCPRPVRTRGRIDFPTGAPAEGDAAKRAPGQGGAAGAGVVAAALVNPNVHVNPVGHWTTQASDPSSLFQAQSFNIFEYIETEGFRGRQGGAVLARATSR